MNSKSRLFWYLFLSLIIIISLHYLRLLAPFENIFLKISSPLEKGIFNLGFYLNDFYKKQISKNNLAEENKKLKEEINELLKENTYLKILEEENLFLKRQLNFIEETKYNLVVSNVIGKISGEFHILTINKGSKDGIKLNAPVVIDEGIIIGKVVVVEDKIAKVMLLDDPRSKLAATVQNSKKTIGLVEGEVGLGLRLNLVPRHEIINNSDIVMTSGLEEDIPRGLLIGRIDKITTETNDLFQNATLEPFISLDKINLVSILIW